ncbi:glucose 1-dehydrogenase [Alicyclobacillus cycloheptanicus]|uniref:NAD(P)-dependent dehydrogenase (Short-subunit alcohol dehydrogenase family) n=1 Tax=Alicyclobacillus cycloheptanicus TaxID=1457 RepID=A0ABT9XH25_9BACL|nr:glucose 1-dehydrogenase [Alicyclobacillus cycloheptanicus]MDQ0189497.1 NAD(P)-dependent dehydrogenase (short-subunit alcohol dehydrogenase family) [Alicyclobacillus cycloheptanicus]WDM01561.1 glucose 1-dehydrogenase [Alicyclobacillus cycloheptanicus]
MRLQDKVCVITGAGGGMGRKAAERFAREGGRIAILERNESAGVQAEAVIRSQGGEAKFFACDASSEDSVQAAVAGAYQHFGRIDVLYNNAGIMPEADHSVLDTSVETWDMVMAVNVRSIFLMSKYVVPHMLEQSAGSIINIASFVALMGCSVPQDAYTASKGAVISLTKSLAIQFRPRGVRSNAICPGPIETPLMTEWLLKDEAAKQVRLSRQPSGRFGRPEDIVNCALYLASDESDWTNGAVIVVDGGITSNYF